MTKEVAPRHGRRTPSPQSQPSANNEDAFRALFLHHPVPTWVADAKTLAILEVNDAAVCQYGYSRDEFLSRTITDIRSPDEEGRPAGSAQGGSQGSNEVSSERHRLKDGRVLDVRVTWRALVFRGREAKVLSAEEITERKQAEERLQRSEQRFRRALENIPDVVVIYDRDLRIQYINDATRRITGRPTSDFIGHREEEIWPPEVYRAYLPTLQEALDTRQVRSVETTILLPAGSRVLRVTCVPLLDEKGDVSEILGITHDHTERQRAADAVRASEEKFRDVFESANVGKSITLPTGELAVNQALAKLLGYTQAELTTMTCQDLTPPEDIESIQAIITPLLKGERDSARFTNRYVHKNGSVVWADVSTVMRRGEDGKPLYFITTVVDITERRLAEEKLCVSERLFSDAFRLGPAGMTITRIADGRFLDVNECFLKTFEFGRDEVIGHTSTELNMFTAQERSKLIQNQLQSGGLRDCELQARSKSGRLMKLLFSSQPIELEGEPCHITIFVDITELRQAQEREQQAVSAANVGLWDWDLRSNKVYYSYEWKRQIGYADHEISDDFSEWQSRLHPEDLGITPVVLPVVVLRVEGRCWGAGEPGWALRAMSAGLGGASVLLQNWCIVLLQVRGAGTPSPVLPAKHLVTEGPYGWLRNPINLGEVAFLVAHCRLVRLMVAFGVRRAGACGLSPLYRHLGGAAPPYAVWSVLPRVRWPGGSLAPAPPSAHWRR